MALAMHRHSSHRYRSFNHDHGAKLNPCRVACPTLHAAAEAMPDRPNYSQQALESDSVLTPASHPAARNCQFNWGVTAPEPRTQQQQQQQQGKQPTQQRQLYAWTVFQQCVMLAAAAFAAAPLILILDIAESACLTVSQAHNCMLFAAHAAANPSGSGTGATVAGQQALVLPSQQQQQLQWRRAAAGSPVPAPAFSTPSGIIGHHSLDRSVGTAHTTRLDGGVHGSSTGASSGSRDGSRSQIKVSGSNARPPVFPLLPPWTAMAVTMVPVLLLLLRHWDSPAVLWPLCLCGGSLMLQGYVNLLLLVLQRGRKPTADQASRSKMPGAATGKLDISSSAESACLQQQHQVSVADAVPLAGGSGSSRRTSGKSQQPTSHGWWQGSGSHACPAVVGNGISNKTISSSGGGSRAARATSALFRMVQVLGDAWRVLCMTAACWLAVQQQAPAVASAWSSCLTMLQQAVSMSNMAELPHAVGAAVAVALKLHKCVSCSLWLGVDVGLCAAASSVYALALAARLAPTLSNVV